MSLIHYKREAEVKEILDKVFCDGDTLGWYEVADRFNKIMGVKQKQGGQIIKRLVKQGFLVYCPLVGSVQRLM